MHAPSPGALAVARARCVGGGRPRGDKDDDSAAGTGGACATLCTDAGWDGGLEEHFSGGIVECTCEGAGAALSQQACTDYCDPHGVPAEYAYLSGDGKCVCDGTQL